MTMRSVLVVSVLLVGCERGAASQRGRHDVVEAPSVATRAAWFVEVEALAASSGGPSEPAWRARLARIVSTTAWKTLPADAFAKAADEIVRFFGAYKQLMVTVGTRGTADDVVDVGMLGIDAYGAILTSAGTFLDALPVDAPTRSVRAAGLEKMRLGAAVEVAGLLYVILDALPPRRDAVLARLRSPATSAMLSREGLQLVLATLDERLLPRADAAMRAGYAAVREAVASAYAQRPAAPSTTRTTYQGMGPQVATLPLSTRVVSTTGGFSVELGPAALAKRVEIGPAGGPSQVQHWIELQDGDTKLEAACLDGTTDATLGQQLVRGAGAVPHDMGEPGMWLAIDRDGRASRIRVLALGGRGCFASIEGPAATYSMDRADAFLRSLRAEP